MKKLVLWSLVFSMGASADEVFTNSFEALIATRVSTLQLKDPHMYVNFGGCQDFTDTIFGQPGLNPQIQDSIENDDDGDGYLDLNWVTQYATDQAHHLVTHDVSAAQLEANCTEPMSTTSCQTIAAPTVWQSMTQVDLLSTCLTPRAGTTSNYSPSIISTEAPCHSTQPVDVVLNLSGTSIPLRDYQQALSYSGGDETTMGLHMGFISEAEADQVILPDSFPLVGGQTLSSVLPGGTGSCTVHDDRDLDVTGTVLGWWFYFNSTSTLVPLD